VRNGRILLKGNDARKLLKAVPNLVALLPLFLDSLKRKSQEAVKKIVPCFELTNQAVHQTMGPILRPGWEQTFRSLDKAYQEFKFAYEKVKKPQKGRETMSLKMRSLTTDVPRYLEKHSLGVYSLSPDAEQAFEHSHVKVTDFMSAYALPTWENDPLGERLWGVTCSGCHCECCKDKKPQLTPWEKADPNKVEKHRKLRRMAIAAYNASLIPDKRACWERALKFVKVMEGSMVEEIEEQWFRDMLYD